MGKTLSADEQAAIDRSQRLFMSTMLNMSWQIAVIVLLFVIGGYKLDAQNNTSPRFTLIGLLIAVVGSGLIVWKAVKDLDTSLKPIKAAQAARKATTTNDD